MIEIKQLNKTYDRRRFGENHVLHDISLTLPDTGFVCILGPSGCGKTSLLNAIGGLDEFDNGTITVGKVTANRYGSPEYEAERNRSFGYIFQNYYLLPEHSVGYNVYLGLHSLKLEHKEKIRRVKEALKAVEMERYIRRNVGELSGGQQQRVAIARALARKPRVIFADEPTGNLDDTNTLNICSLLRRISKQSLVVMVTHEERIARFYADRIITLENGRLAGDDSSWQRQNLSVGSVKSIYTGQYEETRLQANQVSFRIFREEGAKEASISVVVLKDRIVIKLDDDRAVSCGATADAPSLVEGPRPVLTLEEVDRQGSGDSFLAADAENISAEPGSGITLSDMFREARHMGRSKKLRGLGTRIFLMLLAVLLALSVSDFMTLSAMEPEDFITTHSQVLEVLVERGPRAHSSTDTLRAYAKEFKSRLDGTDIPFYCAPDVSYNPIVSGSLILQASTVHVSLGACSYTPMAYLQENTLILGRMPQEPWEVVVDRWVLDQVLEEDGVAQNAISGIDYFLDKQIRYGQLNAAPTIVGICDSGEPSIYISDEMLASIGTTGTEIMALSTFQSMYPGQYDNVVLGENECIVLPYNAGELFWEKLGDEFTTISGSKLTVVGLSDAKDCYAKAIVADEQIGELMRNISLLRFWVYTEDKDAMAEYLTKTAKRVGDAIDVTVTDCYAEKMNEFRQESQIRADGRTVILTTVTVLCAVMLYLLRRADVQGRIGMLSVYRLLGIPSKKAHQIFIMESLLSGVTTVLPAVAAVWAVIGILNRNGITHMVFPWYGAIMVVAGILCFQLAVTALPLKSLLKLPPARLAAKYDF